MEQAPGIVQPNTSSDGDSALGSVSEAAAPFGAADFASAANVQAADGFEASPIGPELVCILIEFFRSLMKMILHLEEMTAGHCWLRDIGIPGQILT